MEKVFVIMYDTGYDNTVLNDYVFFKDREQAENRLIEVNRNGGECYIDELDLFK